MYAAANDILGNIVKVTPSSKVVGDLALALVATDADPEAFAADPGSYDVPDSVIGFLSGELGDPPGGWPEPFRTKALAGRSVSHREVKLEPEDSADVATVLGNLVDNALEHAPRGSASPPSVRVRVRQDPSTSGDVTETADGPADPSQIAEGVDGGSGAGNDPTAPDSPTDTDTGTGTTPDPGTGPGTNGGTGTTPTPTPSPVTSTTEPASAPWVTGCTYYAGKVRTAIGDTGKRVKQVQCILSLRGYDIGGTGVDGVFGEGLEAAMKNFQVDKGLAVNGIVKRVTWDNLRATE
jgi:hypothetical protein